MAESVGFLNLWVPTRHSTRRHIMISKDLVFNETDPTMPDMSAGSGGNKICNI